MAPIKASILLSLATILLAILSISVYIFYGGSAVFYAAASLTIIFGLANAWSISREESEMRSQAQAEQPVGIEYEKHAKRKASRNKSGWPRPKSKPRKNRKALKD